MCTQLNNKFFILFVMPVFLLRTSSISTSKSFYGNFFFLIYEKKEIFIPYIYDFSFLLVSSLFATNTIFHMNALLLKKKYLNHETARNKEVFSHFFSRSVIWNYLCGINFILFNYLHYDTHRPRKMRINCI